ncbi:hypothetical protein [Nitrosopumilus sp.]|uniref:hypothetical protein n=1 Tax=Nitrosopumilus sp. TaxID=2024843 RepID=UPI0034A045E4
MGILDKFRIKNAKRTSPYGIMNKEIPCTGVSLDDLSKLDSKKLEKTVKKNVKEHTKNLDKLSHDDLKDTREKIKRELTPRTQIAPQYRTLWAVKNQKIVLSELSILLGKIEEEIKKRRKTS